ncbi:1-deoxy-D-xylulose-5-phosphate synthase [Anaerosoma tenue]|uniref:1-deoxy-D-xylulose-5-phosphate synthase n=1 Tax=Anaerosoma tenue TaxID=2933588 RepID=UPI0022609B9B|nr:1-deoxy-D-xylulose-5-phosphate synthase [Anaerosoma tenue]MCK8114397.1 1-deoxy-D-xylulose-5-phosphate synthase [Anaerosoma tenue]
MSQTPILDSINEPAALKALSSEELTQLAAEIRATLIATVSETGGHLAPNLGVVELTLGLHRALDCPADSVIWDVGHQAYVHKLITGRREGFGTLRTYGGVCGFPKRTESPYDVHDTGHASTSISVALGLAAARDLNGTDETIVAVIGDGSLTGGMAFEALDHAGHLGSRLIVLLNDNEMSIAPNVGALSSYLARVRLDRRYRRLRDDVESALARTRVGAAMVAAGEAAKESVKQLIVPGMLFEELGIQYVGPIDGHDIAQVQNAITWAKSADGPVLVHAVTRKGMGYTHAEDRPDEFHGVSPFSVETGRANGGGPKPLSYTQVFGDAIVTEAERDQRIVAITAAMPAGTGLTAFAERFPDRFFDVGIAEQHAVGLAAGLAHGGQIPVVAIYSTFIQRAYDQVIMDAALQGLHVVFCLDRAGLVGEDGPTHHGVFDLTFLRAVPGLAVMAPSNEAELADMLHTALAMDGPVAIRYPRGAGRGVALPAERRMLTPGVSETVRQGEDVALLAIGRMVETAERAAESLAAHGVTAEVVDMRWVKPLDRDAVRRAADRPLIVTLEENTGEGGFGGAVMETLAEEAITVPVMKIAIPDCFVTHGKTSILLEEVGLTPESVTDAILRRLAALREAEGAILDDGAQARRRAR